MPSVRAHGALLASFTSMTVVKLIRRLREEFTAMPGLRLTQAQVQRLCGVSASTSESALRALVSAGYLRELADGTYRRGDMAMGSELRSTSGAVEPPWRHILCVVEFEDDRREFLTAASYSALRYATTLGIAHRARVTVLHLVPSLPDRAADQRTLLDQAAEDVRRHALAQVIPGLIDVHVAAGPSSEGLRRSVQEIGADLIVVGREGGAAGLSQAREIVRHAPCHVLVVHPAGQAAVA
jgi:nucleotide-binding universal stress UspA family protein